MPVKIKILLVNIFFLFLFSDSLYSQTFGFGCLGLVGGYGGVVYQSYDATGLNQFFKSFNDSKNQTLTNYFKKFEYSLGYRIGINFFRASWKSGFMITAKGFFQGLTKSNKASEKNLNEITNYTYDLDIKNWALGIDIGYAFTRVFNWKIIDVSFNLNNVSLTSTKNMPGKSVITEYKNDPNNFGYSIGTGIIIDIISNYVSIEGLAGYTYLKVEDLKTDSGFYLLKGEGENLAPSFKYDNLITKGGFTAVLQLNVGFPL